MEPESPQDTLGAAWENHLEDLFTDAMLQRKLRKPARLADPSLRDALDATARRMRELYTNPENWERTRGVALIDEATQTLVGNFSEYVHRTIARTRKLIREHQPIAIAATEIVKGYLGEQTQERFRAGGSWTEAREGIMDLLFEEMQVGAPQVRVLVRLYLGGVARIELVAPTQLSSADGGIVLQLPAGINILEQLSQDSRHAARRAVGR